MSTWLAPSSGLTVPPAGTEMQPAGAPPQPSSPPSSASPFAWAPPPLSGLTQNDMIKHQHQHQQHQQHPQHQYLRHLPAQQQQQQQQQASSHSFGHHRHPSDGSASSLQHGAGGHHDALLSPIEFGAQPAGSTSYAPHQLPHSYSSSAYGSSYGDSAATGGGSQLPSHHHQQQPSSFPHHSSSASSLPHPPPPPPPPSSLLYFSASSSSPQMPNNALGGPSSRAHGQPPPPYPPQATHDESPALRSLTIDEGGEGGEGEDDRSLYLSEHDEEDEDEDQLGDDGETHGGSGSFGPDGHLSTSGRSRKASPGEHKKPYACDKCSQSFNRNHDLKRHRRIHLSIKPFTCELCQKTFSRKDALRRHWLVKACGGDLLPGAGEPTRPYTPEPEGGAASGGPRRKSSVRRKAAGEAGGGMGRKKSRSIGGGSDSLSLSPEIALGSVGAALPSLSGNGASESWEERSTRQATQNYYNVPTPPSNNTHLGSYGQPAPAQHYYSPAPSAYYPGSASTSSSYPGPGSYLASYGSSTANSSGIPAYSAIPPHSQVTSHYPQPPPPPMRSQSYTGVLSSTLGSSDPAGYDPWAKPPTSSAYNSSPSGYYPQYGGGPSSGAPSSLSQGGDGEGNNTIGSGGLPLGGWQRTYPSPAPPPPQQQQQQQQMQQSYQPSHVQHSPVTRQHHVHDPGSHYATAADASSASNRSLGLDIDSLTSPITPAAPTTATAPFGGVAFLLRDDGPSQGGGSDSASGR